MAWVVVAARRRLGIAGSAGTADSEAAWSDPVHRISRPFRR